MSEAAPCIWVDADACPGAIKEVLFRAAQRRHLHTRLVANHAMRVPRSPFIRLIQVPSGFDAADDYIAEQVSPGDLVITADVPLADRIVTAGAIGLNPRGTLYTKETVREHLNRRDFMEEMRSAGLASGGPSALDKRQVQAFANALDRFLATAAL